MNLYTNYDFIHRKSQAKKKNQEGTKKPAFKNHLFSWHSNNYKANLSQGGLQFTVPESPGLPLPFITFHEKQQQQQKDLHLSLPPDLLPSRVETEQYLIILVIQCHDVSTRTSTCPSVGFLGQSQRLLTFLYTLDILHLRVPLQAGATEKC